jgi:uncharacterized protein YcfJ
MLKTLSMSLAAIAMTAGAVAPAAADAQRYRGDRYERAYGRAYHDGYNRSTYRGDRGYRARQKCNDGDGGTIIGAIAGGLLGRSIDSRGDRALGTILGAGAGALAGRAIDRSDRPGYCR